MSIESIEITEFLSELSTGEQLNGETLAQILSEINIILRYDPTAYYKGQVYCYAWDDACDSMRLLVRQHNAIPYLTKMASDEGEGSDLDQFTREWALRVLSKVDGDISEVLPSLLELQRSGNGRMRRAARICLRKQGYVRLVKRPWYDLF